MKNKKTLENGQLKWVSGCMVEKTTHSKPRFARAIAFAKRKGEKVVRVGNLVIGSDAN